jgi:hypothetical protein
MSDHSLPKQVEAWVTGVYGTLHTTIGDVETGPPSKVVID